MDAARVAGVSASSRGAEGRHTPSAEALDLHSMRGYDVAWDTRCWGATPPARRVPPGSGRRFPAPVRPLFPAMAAVLGVRLPAPVPRGGRTPLMESGDA